MLTTVGGAARPAGAVAGSVAAESLVAAPAHDVDAAASQPVREGLERLRREQQQSRLRRAWRSRTRAGRIRLVAFVGLPSTLLLAALIVIIPILYQGTRAYNNVFVDPVPHDPQPQVALNTQGTPILIPDSAGGMVPTVTVPAGAVPPTLPPTATAVPIADWDGTDPVTILLLGVDRREDEPARSDTMILVTIDPVAKTAAMLPIPRDLRVIIPGFGIHKINSAYAFGDAGDNDVPGGGPGLTIRTIEANFGIRVNYFASIDFDGFIRMIDIVGGLTLDVPYPIKDDAYPGPNNQYTRVYFPAGWQHMDGEQVLQYARTRHDDGDGRRSARQEQILLALREKAIGLDLLPQLSTLLGEFGDSVRTDLSPTQVLQLAKLGTQLSTDAITTYSLEPALTEEWEPGEPYYLVPDWDDVGEILSDFTGTRIVPPAAALAHPDYDIPIVIENGTLDPGLAERVAEMLEDYGFSDVTIVELDDAGEYPSTEIVDTSGNYTTAVLVANLVGFGSDVIDEQYAGPAPTATPSPTETPAPTETATPTTAASPASSPPNDASPGTPRARTPTASPSPSATATATATATPAPEAIVIVLGDDAPDPAWSYEPEEEYAPEE